jgi:hypothetical protein
MGLAVAANQETTPISKNGSSLARSSKRLILPCCHGSNAPFHERLVWSPSKESKQLVKLEVRHQVEALNGVVICYNDIMLKL